MDESQKPSRLGSVYVCRGMTWQWGWWCRRYRGAVVVVPSWWWRWWLRVLKCNLRLVLLTWVSRVCVILKIFIVYCGNIFTYRETAVL